MEDFIQGIQKRGGVAERIYIRELPLQPCKGCGKCLQDKKCVIRDPMDWLGEKIRNTPLFALATPVYFLSFPSPLKTFLDRLQPYWAMKEIHGENIREKEGKGIFICTAASREDKIFECIEKQARILFRTLEYRMMAKHLIGGMEGKGEIRNFPKLREKVRKSGEKLILSTETG